jgi:hypothetical protein
VEMSGAAPESLNPFSPYSLQIYLKRWYEEKWLFIYVELFEEFREGVDVVSFN